MKSTHQNPAEESGQSCGRLFVIATPIGNMEDLTYRAAKLLGEVDALACEDTRVTRAIFTRYEIARPSAMFSYHEHNEERAGNRILKLLKEGQSVALCSDAGSPGISDPGYRIISKALDEGLAVEIIPGASAVTAALQASGLPPSSFTFKGFPPRKKGPRKRFLEMEKESPHSLIFFESPLRIGGFLKEAGSIYGDRLAAVCIELTKKFERVHRGYLSDLADDLEGRKVKGEVTLIIAGKNRKFIRPDRGD
ncbi:16S rRNA (cytidine(1402)-2'-O)-methyltransferase [Acidobacteriota bacterium]